jgi:hypothetical protein
MPEFYFTFGVQYGERNPHPRGGHKDGYFTIKAPDEETARLKMRLICGERWSMCYTSPPAATFFPLGELQRHKA